jgi:hypothetical protein
MIFLLAINTLLLLILIFQRQIKLSTLRDIRRIVMSVTEDLATLTTKFDDMEAAVTLAVADIAAYIEELRAANEAANIDLSPLIARAENIAAGLRAAAGSNPGSDDEPPA